MKLSFLICVLLFYCLTVACSGTRNAQSGFKKEYIHITNGYSQVVSIHSGRTKTIYVSGQVGEGSNLETQTRKAFENIKKELEAAGADIKDIVKITTFIVNYDPSQLEIFRSVRNEFFGKEIFPASTLTSVQSLAKKEWLIEIEAIAVKEMKNK